jgi:serine/threonine protein kinase
VYSCRDGDNAESAIATSETPGEGGKDVVAIQKAIKEDKERFYNYLDLAQQQLKIKRDLLRLNHRYYLSLSDFSFKTYLSRGAFSKVYLAERIMDKKFFALKVIDKQKIRDDKMIGQLETELRVLTRTSAYPNYFAIFSLSFQNKKYLFLSMEFLIGGDCLTFLMHHQRFPEEVARFVYS